MEAVFTIGKPKESRRLERSLLLLLSAFCFLISFLASSRTQADDQRPIPLRSVAFEQRLGKQVPLDLQFRDETGKVVHLGDYFGKKPVILTLVYYTCQDLCPLLLDGLVRTLRPLSFDIGKQFNVVTVSFDPRDTPQLAAAKKQDFIQRYGRPGAARGWHFLTGQSPAIRRLTNAVGFRYTYDAQTQEFGHATGVMLLTPGGKTARYFYGIDFSPRDIRLGLIETSENKIGSPIDQLLLFCYHYDPATGKYGIIITDVIRLAGIATVLALGTFILVMLRSERKNKLGTRSA